MNAGVQLTGVVNPQPQMIYDDNYEQGEVLLPRQPGRWTLFSVQPIFTQNDNPDPIAREYYPGRESSGPVQVTWLAADEVAYQFTVHKFIEEQRALQRQAAAQAAGPKIIIPQQG